MLKVLGNTAVTTDTSGPLAYVLASGDPAASITRYHAGRAHGYAGRWFILLTWWTNLCAERWAWIIKSGIWGRDDFLRWEHLYIFTDPDIDTSCQCCFVFPLIQLGAAWPHTIIPLPLCDSGGPYHKTIVLRYKFTYLHKHTRCGWVTYA